MPTIRPMRPDDAEAVRTVDVTAFNVWWRQLRGESAQLAPRTRQNVLYRLDRDPEGCFVATVGDLLVGFIFSCTWGGVGWFGPFAVLPEYQGQDIGKQLIVSSLLYLRQERDRVIGLETMPESPGNLGLYLRVGFQPRLLSLLVTKPLAAAAAEGGLPRWSQAGAAAHQCWLADLRRATSAVSPGLDWSKEIVLTAQHEMGETLLLTAGDEAVGLGNVLLTSQREGWGDHRAMLNALALHPAHTSDETFHALVAACEALAAADGKQELAIPVYTGHSWAVMQLLAWGYRVERSMLRMVLPETDPGLTTDRWVELARWAG